VAARRANFDFYRNSLGDLDGIAFMPEPPGYRSTRWLSVITIDPKLAGIDRESVRIALEEHNIESRPVWKPMHLQPLYRDCRNYGGQNSDRFFQEGLCLPSGSSLTEEQRQRIVTVIRNCWSKNR
jgi:dTDP-4-amino-4,6-dideoxygalactose transaminase